MTAAVRTFHRYRPVVSAMALGVAQSAYDYVAEHRPAVDLTDWAGKLAGTRALILGAARIADRDPADGTMASAAKIRATRLAEDLTTAAVAHFGPGARWEHPGWTSSSATRARSSSWRAPATSSGSPSPRATCTGGSPMSPRPDGRLPEPSGVDVWHIRLDGAGWPHVLDAAERGRAARDHRYAVAHGVTRTVLAAYLGCAPADLRWTRGKHGKPEFTGARGRWRWNLSHSAGHALLAVSVTAPVGVDIERVRPDLGPVALAARFLPARRPGSSPARRTRPRPTTGS
ncbi:acyl-CoA dehydrogenase family protein [Actinokineospora soli]|uniref:Acyl-CoA dehydrogenase family protein n=1 Tax=Actinokineospora soli TaxID=1048753 RepID=A0ABW2TSG4_9PSEU